MKVSNIMIERNRETRRKVKAKKWESKLRKLWDSWWLHFRIIEVKKDKKPYVIKTINSIKIYF